MHFFHQSELQKGAGKHGIIIVNVSLGLLSFGRMLWRPNGGCTDSTIQYRD